MNRVFYELVALGLFLIVTAQAEADIIAVTSPANLTFDGYVTEQPINFVGWDAILSSQISSLAPITTTVIYDSNHLEQFTGGVGLGLRIQDILTNNSGQTWTGFEVQFAGAPGEFFPGDYFSPAKVNITNPSGPNPIVTATVPYNSGSNGGQITLSPDLGTITYSLHAPILNGESLEIHTPVDALNGAGGSFELTFTPFIAVPEPSRLALAGIGFAGLVGYAWRRRKRPAT